MKFKLKTALAAVRKHAMRGFSMIEIMVVITLIAILASMATVYFVGQADKARVEAARAQAVEIAKALDLWKLQFGSYPTVSEGLEVLADPSKANPPRSGPPIMKEIPKDPWKQEYNYANPGVHNAHGVDVWSDGPNGDNADNPLGNWNVE